ncbi:MFS transporter [Heyndrickxia vini]|uniref:MFS transporter n=1 Tax=Heyndrickxia vini TaxID=1476025 RepID=A0ABX7E3W5_9BACI|nr:MFS transporter [Heyndrickxia vini]QQZ10419.1 MFS transporter [Heyndrickxia vini]
MDKRIYILMVISFIVGMVELIIGGILDLIATDLKIGLGKAGILITIYSFILGIVGPVLMVVTAKMERKRLTMIFLFLFLLGNVVTVGSPTYSMLFVGRIISAASASLLINLCLVMAASIADHKYRSRAIGIVSMGISASIVLGLPIGLILGNAFGWRAPFVLIILLTVLSMVGVYFFLSRVKPKPSIPIREQLATLKNRKIFFGQATTFLFLGGHTVLYAYFTPFLKEVMGFEGAMISIAYLIFGIAAVMGGGLGGIMGDRLGTKRTILIVAIAFSCAIFSVKFTIFSPVLFFIVMIIWGMLSWAMSPPMQSYLIEISPETSDIQQSLNNSSLHFGIAVGSLIGGVVIEHTSVGYNAIIGGIVVLLSIGTSLISMYSGLSSNKKNGNKHELMRREA